MVIKSFFEKLIKSDVAAKLRNILHEKKLIHIYKFT